MIWSESANCRLGGVDRNHVRKVARASVTLIFCRYWSEVGLPLTTHLYLTLIPSCSSYNCVHRLLSIVFVFKHAQHVIFHDVAKIPYEQYLDWRIIFAERAVIRYGAWIGLGRFV